MAQKPATKTAQASPKKGKKTEPESAAPKPTAQRRKVAPESAAPQRAKPVKAPAKKRPTPPAPRAIEKAEPAASEGINWQDVAIRAYFISEKRRSTGLPGDEHQDWLEAERQVAEESSAAKKPKKKAS
jgi:hypothetical protein